MFLVVQTYGQYNAGMRRLDGGVGLSGDDRPHYGGGWALNRDLHNWLIEHGVRYSLHWNRANIEFAMKDVGGVWEIELHEFDDETLMLFKLKFL